VEGLVISCFTEDVKTDEARIAKVQMQINDIDVSDDT
jgi:hypothetical protein